MALPREQDTYEDYTEQLVYFGARLAANPTVEALAPAVDALLEQLDTEHEALRVARRAEVRARARRDHQDAVGDEGIKRFRRRLRIVSDRHFAVGRIFPKGVAHTVAPRGRSQLERLDALVAATDEVLASPQLAADPEATELRPMLEAGRATAEEAVAALRTAIEQWETASLEVVRARDVFNFRRADGVGRLGVVLGELRALLGGSARAAYGYTQSGRSGGPSAQGDAEADDAADDAAEE